MADALGHLGDGFLYVTRREVFDDKDFRARTGVFKRLGGVVFAVGARENRDQHARLGNADCRRAVLLADVYIGVRAVAAGFDVAGVNRLEFVLPELLQFA